jgi:hypothetical protein
MRSTLKKAAFGMPLVGLAVLAPVAYAPDRGFTTVDAVCAGSICCFEIGSVCGVLDDHVPHHYTNGDGSCPVD